MDQEVSGQPTATSVELRGGDPGGVPYPVEDDVYVPSGRYVSDDFLAAERDRLWTRIWQVACRLEELPANGDYVEYVVGDQSILVLRDGDVVRAFYNACRHRGSALGVDCGSFHAAQISCPFHGWRWKLDGTNSYVHHKGGFRSDTMAEDELRLRAVRAEVAFGMVWINMDPDAAPLEEALQGIAPTLEATGLTEMRVSWWARQVLPANWKAAIEAFMEAYHVMATHPEFAMNGVDDDVKAVSSYRTLPEGHSWYAIALGQRRSTGGREKAEAEADYFANMNRVLWEGARGQITEEQIAIQEQLLDEGLRGDEFMKRFFSAVFADAARTGTPLKPLSPEQTSHGFLFPNVSFVQSLGNALMFRALPNGNDPHSCAFDIWSLVTRPPDAPTERPTSDAEIEDLWFLQQDMANIRRLQTGLRTRGHQVSRLSPEYEPMITNFHRAIDQVMSRPSPSA